MTVLTCPQCGHPIKTWDNPAPTVDTIIYDRLRGVVLIERGQPPFGYALPGGFVEVGETVEHAAVREALEETGLEIELIGLLGVYSDPARDARRHTMSTVFVARAAHPEDLAAGDDAAAAAFWPLEALPELAFDHARILQHFREVLSGSRSLAGVGDIQSPPLPSWLKEVQR